MEEKQGSALDLVSILFFSNPLSHHQRRLSEVIRRTACGGICFATKYMLFSIMWLLVLHRGEERRDCGSHSICILSSPLVPYSLTHRKEYDI